MNYSIDTVRREATQKNAKPAAAGAAAALRARAAMAQTKEP